MCCHITSHHVIMYHHVSHLVSSSLRHSYSCAELLTTLNHHIILHYPSSSSVFTNTITFSFASCDFVFAYLHQFHRLSTYHTISNTPNTQMQRNYSRFHRFLDSILMPLLVLNLACNLSLLTKMTRVIFLPPYRLPYLRIAHRTFPLSSLSSLSTHSTQHKPYRSFIYLACDIDTGPSIQEQRHHRNSIMQSSPHECRTTILM